MLVSQRRFSSQQNFQSKSPRAIPDMDRGISIIEGPVTQGQSLLSRLGKLFTPSPKPAPPSTVDQITSVGHSLTV